MKDIIKILWEMENEVRDDLFYSKNVLNKDIILLKLMIERIIKQIKMQEKMEDVEDCFLLLGIAQFIASKRCFTKDMNLGDNLRSFVRDFDRLDSQQEKKYLFCEIKKGGYDSMF